MHSAPLLSPPSFSIPPSSSLPPFAFRLSLPLPHLAFSRHRPASPAPRLDVLGCSLATLRGTETQARSVQQHGFAGGERLTGMSRARRAFVYLIFFSIPLLFFCLRSSLPSRHAFEHRYLTSGQHEATHSRIGEATGPLGGDALDRGWPGCRCELKDDGGIYAYIIDSPLLQTDGWLRLFIFWFPLPIGLRGERYILLCSARVGIVPLPRPTGLAWPLFPACLAARLPFSRACFHQVPSTSPPPPSPMYHTPCQNILHKPPLTPATPKFHNSPPSPPPVSCLHRTPPRTTDPCVPPTDKLSARMAARNPLSAG